MFLRTHNINDLTTDKTDIRATIAVEIPHNGLQFRDLRSVISVFSFLSLIFISV